MKIIFNSTSRLIRGTFTHAEPLGPGESERTLSAGEELSINALYTAGKKYIIDDISIGLREATDDEADAQRSFRLCLFARISKIANLTTRNAAYQLAPAILLSVENRDQLGTESLIDASSFPQQQKDKLKSLITGAIAQQPVVFR